MSCVSKDKPCGSKDSKIHLASCTDTHHDDTDLVNDRMVKNTKI